MVELYFKKVKIEVRNIAKKQQKQNLCYKFCPQKSIFTTLKKEKLRMLSFSSLSQKGHLCFNCFFEL